MKYKKLLVTLSIVLSVIPSQVMAINQPKLNMVNIPVAKPVKYTVSTAKEEAFKNVKITLPLVFYKSDMDDRNYATNMEYMKKQLCTSGDRTRMLFPNFIGQTLVSYGIRYVNKPENVYYYNSYGKLLRIEIDNNNPDIYPKKSVTYNNKGKLHSVVLYISQTEQYNFDGQGHLIVHWIGERGFNRMGQPLKIRRSL